jgi:hypothetical protein
MNHEIIKIIDPMSGFETFHYTVKMDNGSITSYILSADNLADSLMSLGFSAEESNELIGALNA